MTIFQLIFAGADLALAAVLYAITITVVAITAIATTNSGQRRAALKVLELLLRKRNAPDGDDGDDGDDGGNDTHPPDPS